MKYTGVLEVNSVKSLSKVCPYIPYLSNSPSLADPCLQLLQSLVPSFLTHSLFSILPDNVPTSLEDALLTEAVGSTQHILLKTVLGKDKHYSRRCSVRWLQNNRLLPFPSLSYHLVAEIYKKKSCFNSSLFI